MNKAIIVGRVGMTRRGDKHLSISVAVKKFTKKEGADNVVWINTIIFNENILSFADKYIKQGSLISICGSIDSSKYTDKNGVEKTSFSIIVNELNLLDKISSSDNDKEQGKQEKVIIEPIDDAIPF